MIRRKLVAAYKKSLNSFEILDFFLKNFKIWWCVSLGWIKIVFCENRFIPLPFSPFRGKAWMKLENDFLSVMLWFLNRTSQVWHVGGDGGRQKLLLILLFRILAGNTSLYLKELPPPPSLLPTSHFHPTYQYWHSFFLTSLVLVSVQLVFKWVSMTATVFCHVYCAPHA